MYLDSSPSERTDVMEDFAQSWLGLHKLQNNTFMPNYSFWNGEVAHIELFLLVFSLMYTNLAENLISTLLLKLNDESIIAVIIQGLFVNQSSNERCYR
jgi:hypothetical protein